MDRFWEKCNIPRDFREVVERELRAPICYLFQICSALDTRDELVQAQLKVLLGSFYADLFMKRLRESQEEGHWIL